MPFAKLEAKVTVWSVEGCTEAMRKQMPRCLRGLKSFNDKLNLFLMIREKPTPPKNLANLGYPLLDTMRHPRVACFVLRHPVCNSYNVAK